MDATHEDESGPTLPQTLWDAMERLHMVQDDGGDGSLSHRLYFKQQLANSACSSVFGATLDGNAEVVVKVRHTN